MAAEATLNQISEDRWRWIIQGQIEGRERDYFSGLNAAERKGRKEGARQNALANARNFLQKSNLSVEMIADCCSLPLEDVLALKKELELEPAK